ncbi:hypothetical protein RHSIM_Rhsim09G0085800 [Rhododendron simsii]|uniref:Uncharacterized protein n=1 Tax=Rhododendron simsii TaxID=118357 RepID=A0A834GDR3_RHOSS|nr:hypothetical protein RHSIM_Rhsim09G0085800 [Rhododendron simsii]
MIDWTLAFYKHCFLKCNDLGLGSSWMQVAKDPEDIALNDSIPEEVLMLVEDLATHVVDIIALIHTKSQFNSQAMDNIFRNVNVVLREEHDLNLIRFLRIGHLQEKNVVGVVMREERDLDMA